MRNQEVARRFFEGKKDHAHTKNMFFEGNAMYSYWYHYLMAYKVPEKKIVFVNANRYSNSTRTHLSYTHREAVRAGYTVIETYKMRQVADDLERANGKLSYDLYIKIKEEINARYVEAEKKEKRARTHKEVWQQVQQEERKQWETLDDNIEAYDPRQILSA